MTDMGQRQAVTQRLRQVTQVMTSMAQIQALTKPIHQVKQLNITNTAVKLEVTNKIIISTIIQTKNTKTKFFSFSPVTFSQTLCQFTINF